MPAMTSGVMKRIAWYLSVVTLLYGERLTRTILRIPGRMIPLQKISKIFSTKMLCIWDADPSAPWNLVRLHGCDPNTGTTESTIILCDQKTGDAGKKIQNSRHLSSDFFLAVSIRIFFRCSIPHTRSTRGTRVSVFETPHLEWRH